MIWVELFLVWFVAAILFGLFVGHLIATADGRGGQHPRPSAHDEEDQ